MNPALMSDIDSLTDMPFEYRETKDGLVRLFRSGRVVTTLRGRKAQDLLRRISTADARSAQLLMAKATGQYKFGNEKAAKRIGKRSQQDRGKQ